MNILAIESSCDETAAAVVADGTRLVSVALATSQPMHAKYGGIIPDRAAREQLKSIIPVISEALSAAGGWEKIDAVAVTYGPGLIGSLLIGVETAKSLSFARKLPLIPVNHLIGHIYANWITLSETQLTFPLPEKTPDLPALVLLVSGGHSELILMKDHGRFEWLGGTRDDAAGECFDKCGRILGLPYPYGPFIERVAAEFSGEKNFRFPRPLADENTLDFSFSGLKTAFSNEYAKNIPVSDGKKSELAHELQEAVTDSLVGKTQLAAKKFRPKSVILAGGVAANSRLRNKLLEKMNADKLPVFIPPISFCTDNAVYIASAAFFNRQPVNPDQLEAVPNLTIRP